VHLDWLARRTLALAALPGDEADVVAARRGLEARMGLLLSELAGAQPTPSIRLVSEAVVFCWAEWWMHATIAAKDIRGTTPMQIRRQQAAHRRFLASVKVYAQISRLEGSPGTLPVPAP
jgi:hypothetical protein